MATTPTITISGEPNEITNYFVDLVKSLVSKVPSPKSKEIIVSAGSYRMYDVAYEYNEETGVLYLDFYSGARHRGLDREDVNELLKLI